MAEEKQVLKRTNSRVTLSGKARINADSFKVDVDSNSGYHYSQANFGVETEDGNTVYVEVMGGFYPNEPFIKTQDSDNNKMEVAWADKNNETIIGQVANYRKFKGGLVREEGKSNEIKEFITGYDLVKYLKDNLRNDMQILVIGQFSYSEYNGDTQRRVNAQNVYLAYEQKDEETKEPIGYNQFAEFNQVFLATELSHVKITKKDIERGKVTIPLFVSDYAKKVGNKLWKKNRTFEQSLVMDVTEENKELRQKMIDTFFKVKKGGVREIGIIGTIREGVKSEKVKKEDIKLSPEIQEYIKMGIMTMESVMESVVVKKPKVRELVFAKPVLLQGEDGSYKPQIDDKKYTLQDLFPPELDDDYEDEDESSDIGTEVKDEEPKREDEVKPESESDDQAWMKALGI